MNTERSKCIDELWPRVMALKTNYETKWSGEDKTIDKLTEEQLLERENDLLLYKALEFLCSVFHQSPNPEITKYAKRINALKGKMFVGVECDYHDEKSPCAEFIFSFLPNSSQKVSNNKRVSNKRLKRDVVFGIHVTKEAMAKQGLRTNCDHNHCSCQH
jgi:hypothetical protein